MAGTCLIHLTLPEEPSSPLTSAISEAGRTLASVLELLSTLKLLGGASGVWDSVELRISYPSGSLYVVEAVLPSSMDALMQQQELAKRVLSSGLGKF